MSEIVVCLQALLDPNSSIRAKAEEQLKQFENQPGFGTELCRILLTNTYDITQRQTAAGVLKQFVKNKWEAEKTPTPVTDGEKATIRDHLLPALGDPNAIIRTGIGMVIARIARADWPERWPNLMPTLITMLHDSNENVIHGSIQTLSMLLTDDTISDSHLPLIVQHLFPEILAIFQSSKYSEQIRVKAAQIFESTINFIVMTESDENLLKPASQWVQSFIQAIAYYPPDLSRRDYGIPCTALTSITTILKASPNILKAHLLSLLPPVWEAFTRGLAVYERAVVRGDDGAMGGPVGEDGMGIDGMAKAVLEFMQELALKKSLKKMMDPHLENIAYYSIDMQLTEDQIEMYEVDPNQYIADEEDDTFSYNPRIAATFVLQNIADNYGVTRKGMKAIYQAIGKRMAESEQFATQPHVWALREAVLLAIGSISEEYAAHEKKAPPTVRPSASLLVDQLLPLLMQPIPENAPHELAMGQWYLKARALWCASQFAETVDKAAAQQFFHACCLVLQPTNGVAIPVPVRIASVKAVSRFSPNLPAAQIRNYVPPIMQVLCSLIPTASEEVLILLLSALLVVARVAPDVTAENVATLGPYVQHVWAHHAADPQITEDAKDILFELMRQPKGFVGLYPSLSVTLHNALYNPDKLPDMLDASMELTRMVASSIYDPADPNTAQAQTLIHTLIQDLYPPISSIALTTQDESLLRTSADCVAVLVRHSHLITPAHLQSAMQLAQRLLDHEKETVNRRAGALITQLIATWASQLAPVLPELLLKVIGRLEKGKLPDLKQDMLMVFIRLINTQYDTKLLFDFLAGINVSGTDGLSFLMGHWTKWQENFSGALNVKVSLSALGKVFRTPDPRLDAITVPGELIVDVNAPRATRSKKVQNDKWSVVPLRIKILYIFAKEYQVLKTKAEEFEEEDDDEGEDAELEDEEEDDTKGQYLDDLMDKLEEEEIEEDDEPLDKLDPLYSISTGKLIEEWMRAAAQETQQGFIACAQQLPADLQQVTQSILHPTPK